jgi:hypothetical protein
MDWCRAVCCCLSRKKDKEVPELSKIEIKPPPKPEEKAEAPVPEEDPEDLIDEQYALGSARRVQSAGLDSFFVLPEIPILQFYDHHVTKVKSHPFS